MLSNVCLREVKGDEAAEEVMAVLGRLLQCAMTGCPISLDWRINAKDKEAKFSLGLRSLAGGGGVVFVFGKMRFG